jgi:hypothetical protein
MKADQYSGSTLVGSGDKYAVAAAGATTAISTAPGRIVKIIPLTGTGTVQVNDNALGNTSGQVIWPALAQAIGTPIVIDAPIKLGIAVTMGATSTALVIYA